MPGPKKKASKYQDLKLVVHEFLQYNRLFRLLIEISIVVSLIIVAIDFFVDLESPYEEILFYGDWIIVFIFSAEYITRVWASGHGLNARVRYIITPEALIDLIAIAPYFRFMRLFRLLRLLRLFRLVKLARYNDSLIRQLNGLLAGLNQNTFMVISILGVILSLILLGAFVVNMVDPERMEASNFISDILWSTYALFDFGAMNDGVSSITGQLVSIVLSLVGIVVFGIVVGIITSSLISYFINIREGLMESTLSDHVIICGWNDEVPNIVEAMDGYRDIVILAEKESDETDIRQVIKMGAVQYVYGNPADKDALCKAGVERCHHILIVRDETRRRAIDIDARALMIILTIRNLETDLDKHTPIPIAAELSSTDLMKDMHLSIMKDVHIVGGDSLAAQLLTQTVFNPHVVTVYNSFLYQEGDEIYTSPLELDKPVLFANLAKVLFEEQLIAIGYINGEDFRINPDRSSKVKDGDRVIVIGRDHAVTKRCVKAGCKRLNKNEDTDTNSGV